MKSHEYPCMITMKIILDPRRKYFFFNALHVYNVYNLYINYFYYFFSQNKVFIYRGNEFEQLNGFKMRLQIQFPGAQVR